MQKKTHIAFGAVLGTAAIKVLPLAIDSQLLYYGAGVVIGSLLPDIDHRGSALGKKLPFISSFISFIFGHRRFFHSLLFVGLLAYYLYPWLPFALYLGLLLGIISHLIGDMMTPAGIQLLFPFKTKVHFPVTFKAGGIMEQILFLLFIIGTIYFSYDLFRILIERNHS